MDKEDLLAGAIAAFNSARDAGHGIACCIQAVLDVASSRVANASSAGMGIVSFAEAEPGEDGPEISLKTADDEAWTLETVALTSDIFVAAHPSGNGFVVVHARGFHQWLRHGDGDCHLEVVNITAAVGPPVRGALQ